MALLAQAKQIAQQYYRLTVDRKRVQQLHKEIGLFPLADFAAVRGGCPEVDASNEYYVESIGVVNRDHWEVWRSHGKCAAVAPQEKNERAS